MTLGVDSVPQHITAHFWGQSSQRVVVGTVWGHYTIGHASWTGTHCTSPDVAWRTFKLVSMSFPAPTDLLHALSIHHPFIRDSSSLSGSTVGIRTNMLCAVSRRVCSAYSVFIHPPTYT